MSDDLFLQADPKDRFILMLVDRIDKLESITEELKKQIYPPKIKIQENARDFYNKLKDTEKKQEELEYNNCKIKLHEKIPPELFDKLPNNSFKDFHDLVYSYTLAWKVHVAKKFLEKYSNIHQDVLDFIQKVVFHDIVLF